MNRKQKIIVSIVGISIISLALIGLTYGYYLTRIEGNTNDKSISISTANLELTYSDNSDVITGTNIVPGTTLGTKTFTLTNTGNNNVDSYSVGLVNVINTFTRLDDIKYTVTCSSSVADKTCNGVSETTFPNENSYIIKNQINKDEVQTYEITVEYKEMNIDQSIDMGKTLEAKIDIFDTKSLTIQGNITNYSENDYIIIHSKEQTSEIIEGKYKFIGIEPDTHKITIKNRKTTTTKQTTLNVSKGEPSASGSNITYNDEKNIADADIKITGNTVIVDVKSIDDGKFAFNKGTLAYEIYTNAENGSNGTIYSEITLTEPAEEISGETERTLSLAIDDYGNSYYYRGTVTDNYVNFAGMCWKIVRIAGDGSIKLILEDQDSTCATSNGNWDVGTGYFGVTSDLDDLNLISNNEKKYRVKLLAPDLKFYINYLNSYGTRSMAISFQNFQSNKLTEYFNKLKVGDWCLNDISYDDDIGTTRLSNEARHELYSNATLETEFYYDSRVRLYSKVKKQPSLKCNGTNMNKFADGTDMYVGALTADEIIYAGGKIYANNANFYLLNNYQVNQQLYFASISPSIFGSFADHIFGVNYYGTVNNFSVDNDDGSFRPAINLKSNIQVVSGDGTQSNPYVIK